MIKLIVPSAAVLLAVLATRSEAQTFQTIHTFAADGFQGVRPMATLTIGPDRSLYGTASEGGVNGAGTAFRYTTAGTFERLGSFETAETGKAPWARLVNLGDGFLYGVSSVGSGTAGAPSGTVFKLDPAGGPTVAGGLTKIFALPGFGTTPMVPLSLASGEPGVLHVLGSSPGGIWRVPLDGNPPTNVFNFTEDSQGDFPQRIVRGSNGFLYGVTEGTGSVGTAPGARGTVFVINPNGTGFTTLHDCLFETGVNPAGGLAEGPDGSFYGTTKSGGEEDGVIFRISPSNEYTVLHHISDNSPHGDLLYASDGRLYGTSFAGGLNLYGSVFRVNPNGSGFQVIHHFNKTNGAYPKAGLVQGDDGNLYGVTSEGGENNKGTIFRIDLNLPTPEVNRPPVAVLDRANSLGNSVNIPVLANDFDADEDPLTVSIEDQPAHGTVTVEDDGSITYFPGVDYDGVDEFYYKITDPDGLSGIARVAISAEQLPEVWQPGVYNGIFYLDPNLQGSGAVPRGQLVINVNATGVFTGKLFTQKKRVTVRGFFNEDGVGIGIVTIPRQGKALIFLGAGEEGTLTAILVGKENWTGSARPFEQAGPQGAPTLTMSIRSDLLAPLGPGFGFMKIFPTGVVGVVGKLGDGTRFTCATTLTSGGYIPFFAEPMKNGVIAGLLGTPVGTPYAYGGSTRWIRPPSAKPAAPFPFTSGFSDSATILAFPFVPAAIVPLELGGDGAGEIFATGGGLPATQATFSVPNTRLIPAAPLKAISINRNTGIFTGKIKMDTKTVSFQGAVFQAINEGEGFFFNARIPGTVRLIAQP